MRLHTPLGGDWETVSGETYVTLAGGTTTTYYVWVTIGTASSAQMANSSADRQVFSELFAVQM
jgi:hypothetical protein